MHTSSKKPLQPKADKFLPTILTFLVINGKQSTFFQLCQFLCSEIQYIAVILWMQTSFLSYDTQNPISIFIHNFSKILAFRDFLQGESLVRFLSTCIIALWIYSAFLIILLAYILLKAWRKQDISVKIQTYINSLIQFHSSFIFWIANMVFMTVISSNWHGTNFPVISVHQSEDKILAGTQILFVLFNYGIGFIGAIFCFDPFCTINLFAARIPTFQFLTFFFKALMAPICAFSPYDDAYSRILFIIAALIISAMRMLHIMREFPFYRYFPTKLAIIFATIGLWLSGTNILALIWLKQDLTTSLSLFYIIILTLPVTVKVALERFSRIIEYYITVEPKNLRTKAQVCAKLFAYKFLSDNIHLGLNDSKALDRYEAYFIGDLALHAKSCNDLECLCKSFLANEDKTVSNKIKGARSSVSKYFENVSAAFLAEAIQKGKDRNEMKVTLADFMFTNTVQRFSAALIYLFGTAGTHVSFYKRIKRSILTKKIQARIIEYYNDSKDGKLNIVKFLDFQTDSADFLSRITSITTEYLDFWDTVKKANFKFTDILKKSESIEHAADKIDKLWNSHVEKYDSFYHQMREPYSIYLSLVRNTPSASANVINKLKWKKKPRASENDSTQITEGDLASSKVLSFHISMVKERIGRVNQVSENVQNSLGYLPKDIVGKSINYLMPSTFAEKHDQLLLRHLEKSKTGGYTENYHTVNSFVKTKAGYIVPCSIYITLFPYIQHELIYCGLLKVFTTKFDFIILDERGYIDGCTEGVNKKLNLAVEKKLHIKEICLDIDRLLTGFSNKKEISSLATEGALDFNNVKKKFTLDHTDGIKEEGVPGAPMVLTFVKWNMSHQYYKYNLTLNKNTILNKNIFILQMEMVYENRSSQKVLKSEVEQVYEEDSIEDIPAEKPAAKQITFVQKVLEEDLLSDSKEDYFSETTLQRKSLLHKLPLEKKTVVHSEWSENNFDKRTSSHFVPTTYTQTKFASLKKLINSMEIIGGATPKRRKASMESPVRHEKVQLIPSERGSTTSASSSVNSKLETAIYSVPKDRSNYLLKIFLWILILIGLLMQGIFQVKSDSELAYVKENVSVMSTSTLRLFQITELNRRARMASLSVYGYVSSDRDAIFGISIPFIYIVVAYVGYISGNITEYNNIVVSAFEKIEPNLQEKIFANTVPIYDPDIKGTFQYETIFDAATTLAIQAGQFAKTNPLRIQKDNYNVNFILNNTLNQQLVVSEQVTSVLLEDNTYKLNSIRNLIIYFMLIIIFLNVMMLGVFTKLQFNIIKSRNKFIELFLRFKDDELEQSLAHVRVFRDIVLKKGLTFEDAMTREARFTAGLDNYRVKASAKDFRITKREANLKGINYRVILVLLLFVSLFLVILVPLISLSVIMQTSKSIIDKNVNILNEINSNLYDMNLISVAIYEYIQWNGTTEVRMNPIGEEFEATFTRLTKSGSVFINLLNDNKDANNNAIDSQLEVLISGSVCSALNITAMACRSPPPQLQSGLIGLNSYSLMTLRLVKDSFDVSNRTFADGKKALSEPDLINLEYIYTIILLPIYIDLENIVQDRVDQEIENLSGNFDKATIASSICSVIIGAFIAGWLYRLVEMERIRWRKLMRKIPFNVALTNKVFKNYLVRESDHLLDSLKNSL